MSLNPRPSIYQESQYFKVRANDQKIPVISYLTEENYDYVHFSFSGTTTEINILS
ncbi:hypothetical protein GCM10008013_42880 [Paenibacillus segetis]|uniref:Uncharacterized protein n=1 Tax=Paenibacillus segetis TaxID=1325360 RepID=A0ABQ1YRN0_9BACL|nr:hypothetical protein GCM10008013_42880 [Paenibacillus segetis]